MKYLIIGAGGTGACLGAYLAHAGQEVTFIARGKHLEAMQTNGLTIHSKKNGNFSINPCSAYTMADYQDTPDVIFVCVKYYGLSEVNDFINRIATPNTLVIPILNIFGTGEVMAKACPNCTVLDGCIYIVGLIEAPGIVSQPADIFKVYFGYRKNQPHTLADIAKKVEQDLNLAQIEGHLSENIARDALQKFSFVSPMGAAGLYYNCGAGDFMLPGEKQDTFIQLVQEVENLGHAMGITFESPLKDISLKILFGLAKDATTSMQRDVKAGGSSEIDGLVHRVVRLAKEYHVAVPTYEKISAWAQEHSIS